MSAVISALLIISGAATVFASEASQDSQDVDVFLTTATKYQIDFLRQQSPAKFVKLSRVESDEMPFHFQMGKLMQKIDGFGASFTESCTLLADKLSAPARKEFLIRMFSKTHGAGFDNMRLPVGATDFSDGTRGSYSYNETRDGHPDPEFRRFDMSRDEKTFTLIRQAKEINPGLQVMISPWSAPGWMKTSKHVNGGKLKKEHYQDYANYLVKVIQEYRKRGLPVTSMTVQNEPLWEWFGVPSMEMSFEEQSLFIRRYLGPTLKQRGVEIDIWAHDHNFDTSVGVANNLLRHPLTRSYIKGVAFHCYDGHRFEAVNPIRKFPNLQLMNTECTGSDFPEPNEDDSFHAWAQEQAVDAIRVGNTGSMAWNLCLDQNHGPMNMAQGTTGCKNCRGMVTLDFSKAGSNGDPEFDFNPEYYAFAQINRFTTTNSRMIAAKGGNDSDVHGIGIQNEDGSVVLVVQNLRRTPLKFSARGVFEGKMLKYELPPRSVTTFVWKGFKRR